MKPWQLVISISLVSAALSGCTPDVDQKLSNSATAEDCPADEGSCCNTPPEPSPAPIGTDPVVSNKPDPLQSLPEPDSDDPEAMFDKDKNKDCRNGTPLPAGCTIINGSQGSAEWLHCWRTNSGDWFNLGDCITCLATCPIADADEAQIAMECGMKPTAVEKIVCKMKKINEKMIYTPQDGNCPEGKVCGDCKNFKECLEHIANACGIDTNRECGFLGIFPFGTGHCWNEYDVDDDGDGVADRRCVMNAQNSIMYCCPIGSLPFMREPQPGSPRAEQPAP